MSLLNVGVTGDFGLTQILGACRPHTLLICLWVYGTHSSLHCFHFSLCFCGSFPLIRCSPVSQGCVETMAWPFHGLQQGVCQTFNSSAACPNMDCKLGLVRLCVFTVHSQPSPPFFASRTVGFCSQSQHN